MKAGGYLPSAIWGWDSCGFGLGQFGFFSFAFRWNAKKKKPVPACLLQAWTTLKKGRWASVAAQDPHAATGGGEARLGASGRLGWTNSRCCVRVPCPVPGSQSLCVLAGDTSPGTALPSFLTPCLPQGPAAVLQTGWPGLQQGLQPQWYGWASSGGQWVNAGWALNGACGKTWLLRTLGIAVNPQAQGGPFWRLAGNSKGSEHPAYSIAVVKIQKGGGKWAVINLPGCYSSHFTLLQ